MWCWGEGAIRGGVARMPADLASDAVVTVWGLDVRGKPSIDASALGALGLRLADDHPFSRRIILLVPNGAAERSGLRLEDVIMRIGDRSVEELGNGTARNYLGFVLTGQKSVPITVLRGGATLPLVFKLD
jgi:C-terminal processing protease CtpA/Prc